MKKGRASGLFCFSPDRTTRRMTGRFRTDAGHGDVMPMTMSTLGRTGSIEHALLLRRQLRVEQLDRLAARLHFCLTLLRHRLHLVQSLRRFQLLHFFPQSLSIRPLPSADFRRIDELAPGSFLRRLQIQFLLQCRQIGIAPGIPTGSRLGVHASTHICDRLALTTSRRTGAGHGKRSRSQNTAASQQTHHQGTFDERTLIRFHCALLKSFTLPTRNGYGMGRSFSVACNDGISAIVHFVTGCIAAESTR
jgi:hypothetical protein